MITDYIMISEKSNRLQVIMITDYDYPISDPKLFKVFSYFFSQMVYCSPS